MCANCLEIYLVFKSKRLYLKVFVNRMELINLETREQFILNADPPFSGERQALADFNAAEILLRQLVRDAGLRTGFLAPGMHMLVHQLERCEGGLSQLELRGLRDLGNMAGARIVHIIEGERALSVEEAIAGFSDPTITH